MIEKIPTLSKNSVLANTYRRVKWSHLILQLAILLLCSCAQHVPHPDAPHTLYITQEGEQLASRFAPAFLVYETDQDYNKIGSPAARLLSDNEAKVYVDPDHPVVFYSIKNFSTTRARYTNIIYRVHFNAVPNSIIPFNLTAGKNVGLMVIITLDKNHTPVLITTLHTCGCYLAIIPTNHLPAEALPKNWQKEKALHIYGETLPSLLTFSANIANRLVVEVGPSVHRIINLTVQTQSSLSHWRKGAVVSADLRSFTKLEQLPVEGGQTTSFFHESGLMKGYVKGSIKPWESFLMSILAMDFFVGTDKAYAETANKDNPFYTSLKPWRRQDSNIWNFSTFLEYWGWRL